MFTAGILNLINFLPKMDQALARYTNPAQIRQYRRGLSSLERELGELMRWKRQTLLAITDWYDEEGLRRSMDSWPAVRRSTWAALRFLDPVNFDYLAENVRADYELVEKSLEAALDRKDSAMAIMTTRYMGSSHLEQMAIALRASEQSLTQAIAAVKTSQKNADRLLQRLARPSQ